ncbi:MAG: DUF4251 domain-containing protein [Bacteroidales bacterium]|jgi:hypothetical protein|nr:DUF4251 domain-containing protein [Bacteroidales bacterium]MDD2263419.1 DUF4251 domain-containing protein [Bacteroidales bacterium]MDD2830791.1 DUF4251 domain-containing protein [Bacteroidales bacterium]MDD3207990.1 DUF4251 domain-containing protein [Bacteroidales bacterium]MDD3696503.1 DUF4251 domain-containing protein [Bacteroidales bacterium]
MKKIIFILLCIPILMPAGAYSQSQREARAARKAALEEQVRTLVEGGTFEISFDRANPARGKSIILSPVYEMKFQNNRVSTYLPYFGRFYTAPADPTKLAIELVDREVETAIKKDRRKSYSIIFSTNITANETITFYLRISASGTASLSINSSSRAIISYLGNLKM